MNGFFIHFRERKNTENQNVPQNWWLLGVGSQLEGCIRDTNLLAHCLNFYGERKTLRMFDVLQSLAREKFYAFSLWCWYRVFDAWDEETI